MNYGTLKNLVTRNLGGRDDLDAFISEWINSCYLDIVTRGKFPELRQFAPVPIPALDDTTTWVTEDGTPDYSMAPNALFPVSLRDTTNDQPLSQRGIRWYDRHKDTSTGKPVRYAIYGGRYYLDPTPDGIYTIQERFRKKVSLPALAADEDVPIVGAEWHELIELGASYRGARSLSYPDATRWMNDMKEFMAAHSEQDAEALEDADIGFTIVM